MLQIILKSHLEESSSLEKKNINKGDKEVRKYECQCEPNLEKCSKNCFYNYIK